MYTPLYVFIVCPICTGTAFITINFISFVYFSVHCTLCMFVFYNHCCLVRINKWMNEWILSCSIGRTSFHVCLDFLVFYKTAICRESRPHGIPASLLMRVTSTANCICSPDKQLPRATNTHSLTCSITVCSVYWSCACWAFHAFLRCTNSSRSRPDQQNNANENCIYSRSILTEVADEMAGVS